MGVEGWRRNRNGGGGLWQCRRKAVEGDGGVQSEWLDIVFEWKKGRRRGGKVLGIMREGGVKGRQKGSD